MAQRNTSRKPRSSNGASRRGSAKKRAIPGWMWLITGVLVGAFAAFLVYITRFDASATYAEKGKTNKESIAQNDQQKNRTAKETPANNTKSPSSKEKEKVADAATKSVTATKPEQQTEKPAINYDFYKILPQYEVVVPEGDTSKPTNTAQHAGTYYLQVGAFRQMQEADSRKAGLAMLGIVSSIQTVTVDPGNTWHRVRIGPVKDMRQLDRTKRQLQENNISFVTLKEKS